MESYTLEEDAMKESCPKCYSQTWNCHGAKQMWQPAPAEHECACAACAMRTKSSGGSFMQS